MQQKPVRSQIYLPVLRFGITDEDWGLVILASLCGYAVPFLLGLRLWHIPAELIGWLLTMSSSVLLLNLIRRQSRPGWLKFTLQAKLRGRLSRRWPTHLPQHRWLI